MNALIPAFVAVLLAEIGGPLAIFGRERRYVGALIMCLLVIAAIIGGAVVADFLITAARTLLLGLALLFAGGAQFGRQKPVSEAPTIIASAMLLYRSPTPFLAFAFCAWMSAPVTAGIGALAGLAMAAVIGALDFTVPRAARIGAGAVLCSAGIFAVLNGLRLV